MPVHYSIQAEMCLVVTKATGALTREELLEFCRILQDDRRFVSHFNQLIEVASGAATNLSYGDLVAVRLADPFSLRSKRAFVVYSDVDFGMARMYEMVRGGNVQVFRSVEDAIDFLGLPSGGGDTDQ